jgi:hypothetical protein
MIQYCMRRAAPSRDRKDPVRKRPPQEGGQSRNVNAPALIRTICSLSCSTATRIVIGRGCGSCGAGLCGFYHDRSRGTRCSATHDRASHTAHGGSNWPTYDGSSYGTPRCSGQSTIVIGGSYCRKGKNGRTRKGNN